MRVKSASATLEFQPGNFSSGKPGGLGRRPDRHHAVAVFAQDQGRHLGGGKLELFGDQAAKPGGVELGSQADHLAGRQVELANGQVGQDIDRVGDDQHDGVALDAGRRGLAEDAQEQLDVAIDQVEPALVRLAAQAGRDDDDVALGNGLVAGRADPLIGDQRGAVEQVEGLAADLVGVQVDQVDLADHAAALQGEGRGRADQAAAADDADFHGSFSPPESVFTIRQTRVRGLSITWPIRSAPP